MKKILSLLLAFAFVVTISSVSSAAPGNSPLNLLSTLTGKTLTELLKEKEAGKTAYQIAEENGKLEEFKDGKLDLQKGKLDNRVKNGNLSQEDADKVYKQIQENMANCDGTGSQKGTMREALGQQGMGQGQGMRQGQGMGQGHGQGQGSGQRGGGSGTGVRQYNCVQ